MNETALAAIQAAMTTQGLSQNALAALTGIPQPTLWRILSGQTKLHLDYLEKIAPALGLTLNFSLIGAKE